MRNKNKSTSPRSMLQIKLPADTKVTLKMEVDFEVDLKWFGVNPLQDTYSDDRTEVLRSWMLNRLFTEIQDGMGVQGARIKAFNAPTELVEAFKDYASKYLALTQSEVDAVKAKEIADLEAKLADLKAA